VKRNYVMFMAVAQYASRWLCVCLLVGNCVVLKPSEVSEQTAEVLEKVCHEYLDKVRT